MSLLYSYLVGNICLSCVLLRMDHTWITNHHAMAGNIKVDICIGCNQNIISDCYTANDYGVCTYPNIITKRWTTLIFSSLLSANGCTLIQIAVFSNNCIRVNIYIVCMSYIQPISNIVTQYFKSKLSSPKDVSQCC